MFNALQAERFLETFRLSRNNIEVPLWAKRSILQSSRVQLFFKAGRALKNFPSVCISVQVCNRHLFIQIKLSVSRVTNSYSRHYQCCPTNTTSSRQAHSFAHVLLIAHHCSQKPHGSQSEIITECFVSFVSLFVSPVLFVTSFLFPTVSARK